MDDAAVRRGQLDRAVERVVARPGRIDPGLPGRDSRPVERRLVRDRKLLEFLFQIHDPTTLNRQGNDRGLSYRSAIYYTNDEQKRVALDTIADVDASGLWPGRVVTKVTEAGPFWEAEAEDQDYLQHYPDGKNQFSR